MTRPQLPPTGNPVTSLRLTKLHGCGNDFLVLIDRARHRPLDRRWARALCDRHEGVGADGVLTALAPTQGGDVRLVIQNADGTRARMSGNGVRCLAAALVESGLAEPGEVVVETDAGARRVRVDPTAASEWTTSVEMGKVRLGSECLTTRSRWRSRTAVLGNRHLVVLVDSLDTVDIDAIGPQLAREAGDVNIEWVAADAAGDGIEILVWERGVGVTRACGTGSCAAAAAARGWGMAGDDVRVRNPGGTLRVELRGPGPERIDARLTGPVQLVAHIEVDPRRLHAWTTGPRASGRSG
ncbi:MAG TPA: diaminopimelate epimerase [Verrucomicrobiae bacterium]|nr:diaminopimelate epimerase [Verrucomicrobiae bacterium]